MSTERYSKYKPSPLPWNKEIPAHWISRRGKFIFKVINQRSEAGSEELLSVTENWGVIPRKNANVTMFQAESYEGYKLCQKGDLVINSLWAWGKGLGFSEYAGIVSTAYSVYRLKKHSEHNYKYYNYLLRTPGYVGEYLVRSKGVWISRLQLSDMAFLDMQIVIPPVEEQTAIANYLDAQNEKINLFITKKKKLIELLIKQRQAIIAKAVSDENVNGKSISKNWDSRKLKFVAKIIYGQSPNEETYNEKGVGSILINGPVEYSESDFGITRESKWTTDPKKFAKKGDILFCLRGSTTGRLNICHDDVSIGRGVAAIRPLFIDYDFFVFALQNLRSTISHTFEGSTFPSVTSMDLNNYFISYPNSVSEQQQIVKQIKSETKNIDEVIIRTEKEIELIKEYLQSIIAEVVTGKIKISA